jgi:hypothetical protein
MPCYRTPIHAPGYSQKDVDEIISSPKNPGIYDNRKNLMRERWIELNGEILLQYKTTKSTIDGGSDFILNGSTREVIDCPVTWGFYPDYDHG